MSLWKSIEHGKDHRNIRKTHTACSCERCQKNLLIRNIKQAPVGDDGNILLDRRLSNKYKSMKNGTGKNYRGR